MKAAMAAILTRNTGSPTALAKSTIDFVDAFLAALDAKGTK